MKFSALSLVLMVVISSNFAKANMQLEISPIIAYEKIQILRPTVHSKERFSYGASISTGIPLVSIEGTYLQGQSTDKFPLPEDPSAIKVTTQRAMVGLKSEIRFFSLMSFVARAGGHALRQTELETFLDGSSAKHIEPDKISPYAGAGFIFNFFGKFRFFMDAKGIFEKNSTNKPSWLISSGFTIKLP